MGVGARLADWVGRIWWGNSGNLARIGRLRNAHSGRRAFLIGNGPSLRPEDLDRLRNEVTFAANKIFLLFDQTAWRPTYYNVEDLLVIEQNYRRINQLRGFTKLLNANHLPPRWKRDEDTVFYRLTFLPPKAYPGFSIEPSQGLCCGYSVTYSSLQWAVYMGAREIYLLGVDFSFSVPKSNPKGFVTHSGEQNHFSSDYRQPGERWVVPRLDLQEQALRHSRDWLSKRGVRVCNATRGGKLEVFPRVEFDRLFEDRAPTAPHPT